MTPRVRRARMITSPRSTEKSRSRMHYLRPAGRLLGRKILCRRQRPNQTALVEAFGKNLLEHNSDRIQTIS